MTNFLSLLFVKFSQQDSFSLTRTKRRANGWAFLSGDTVAYSEHHQQLARRREEASWGMTELFAGAQAGTSKMKGWHRSNTQGVSSTSSGKARMNLRGSPRETPVRNNWWISTHQWDKPLMMSVNDDSIPCCECCWSADSIKLFKIIPFESGSAVSFAVGALEEAFAGAGWKVNSHLRPERSTGAASNSITLH
jgi:hypothetical protein